MRPCKSTLALKFAAVTAHPSVRLLFAFSGGGVKGSTYVGLLDE